MPTKIEAISRFLKAYTHGDLASLYTPQMECQVNVAQDNGERIDGEYMGRKWIGWTDSVTTWKSFRIPYKAMTEPEYEDREISFDLESHVEGIGLTGWDWVDRESKWVAFDIDHILNHASGNTEEEIQETIRVMSELPWITIRRSTSGNGTHAYIFLDGVPTKNHNEHAALARAILGKLTAMTCYDFESKVDVCGGNMWVWHRKMKGTNGLELIKQGGILKDIPINWRDHLKVIRNKSRRVLPKKIEESNTVTLFDELCGQRPRTPLDKEHKAVLDYLESSKALWWWDSDNHLLVTHTVHLQEAYNELCLRGFFKTISTGKERGTDYNCFAFPMRNGAWSIRRYGLGVEEHPYWDQDSSGWTTCYLNRIPTFDAACRSFGGLEDPTGGYIFRDGESARQAALLFGVTVKMGIPQMGRRCKLKQHKDGRLVVEVDHDAMDRSDEMGSWLQKKGIWTKIYNTSIPDPTEPEITAYDDTVRHLVTMSGEDSGWVIRSGSEWKSEPLQHVRIALTSLGLPPKDVNSILGSSIFRCWTITNKPFQPEYPGNREWNRNAAQFRYKPTQSKENLKTPHWNMILNHCGEGLTSSIESDAWCQQNGITRGEDYLRCWIAKLFQDPLVPLPYLFFYGPQNSGKSIFHEALSLLLTKGYVRADRALTDQTGFNGELAGAIICVVEETDIGRSKVASNRIKDWVTAREISIRPLYQSPYHIPNSTHWIQVSNDHSACPILPGDTRITMCYVPGLDSEIPKGVMLTSLEKEAPDFISSIMNLEVPESPVRLGIPVITTEDKQAVQLLNRSPLETFINEKCRFEEGRWIKFSDFYEELQQWLDPEDFQKHSKIYVGRHIPPQFPKGRSRSSAQWYLGNICWINEEFDEPSGGRYVLHGDFLDIVAKNPLVETGDEG